MPIRPLRAAGLALALTTGCIPQLPDLADPCAAFPDPGLFRITVDAAGDSRNGFLYVPAGEGPRDVVFMLHGGGQTAMDMVDVSGWTELADKEGFAVVFPQGTGNVFVGRAWNSGTDSPINTPDVTFLDAAAVFARDRVCGDHVFAVGFSNGGSMVHRWACQGRELDAAMPTEAEYLPGPCNEFPRPIRIVHGTADPTIAYEGGTNGIGATYPSVDEVTAIKREQNHCTDAPPTVIDNGRETCQVWDCDVPTEQCAIAGWPHLYPGGLRTEGLTFDATREGWDWFAAQFGEGATTSEPPTATGS